MAVVPGRETTGWRQHAPFIAFLVVHVVVWTVVPALIRGPALDKHGDMMENFVWGQEWQWGYQKHPPFFSWVSATWLGLTGFSPWSYFLLSQINVAIAFIAIRGIAREYLTPTIAITAVMLMELVPTYSLMSFKFNSHSILLSLWPLTALFTLRAVTRGRASSWALLGLFAGLAMLSMYYSALLLACLVLLLVLTPEGRWAFRTSGPYVALLVFAAVLAPHVLWLVENDFPPFRYALAHFDESTVDSLLRTAEFAAMNLFYIAPLLIAVWLLFKNRGFLRGLSPGDRSFGQFFLPVAVLGPFLLAIGAGLLMQVRLSSVWGIPLWFAISVLLLTPIATGIDNRQDRAARRLVGILLVLMPTAALVTAALSGDVRSVYSFPARELAAEVTERWRANFDQPLEIIGGSKASAQSIAFYSPDHPSVLVDFDLQASPWLTPARIEEMGIAVVCSMVEQGCFASAREMFPGAVSGQFTVEGTERVFGRSRDESFRYLFIPPAGSR